jgi:hypothetical protein
MKTLKQIREEYDNKFLDQIELLSDELMLEGEGLPRVTKLHQKIDDRNSKAPSLKNMPFVLLFRRVQYRIFPKNQIVALYYSSMIDKYLSIPFGKDGNVNLSEAVVHDSLEEAVGKDKKDDRPSYDSGSVKEGFRSKFQEIRKQRNENWVTGLLGGAGGALLSALTNKDPVKDATTVHSTALKRQSTPKQTSSTWSRQRKGDAVYQSRLKAATEKEIQSSKQTAKPASIPVAENKMSDIRKMIKEGIEIKDLNINGRSVTLNTSMAKRILEVYDSVNTKNKKIVESMLNEDLESFKKLLNFSIKQ